MLFDLYGTLVDVGTRTHPYRTLIAASPRPVSPRALILQRHSRDELGRLLGCQDPTILEAFQRRLEEELSTIRVYPHALPLLRQLRADGLALGVVSNLAAPYAAVLEGTALGACFDAHVLSCDVGVAKPQAAIFRHALGALGCRPDEALMVGDSVISDCRGARAAGMTALHLCRQGPSREPHVLRSLRALPEHLRRLRAGHSLR